MQNETYGTKVAERRLLSALTITCYSATLTALAALAHSVFQLALRDAGRFVAELYSTHVF